MHLLPVPLYIRMYVRIQMHGSVDMCILVLYIQMCNAIIAQTEILWMHMHPRM